MQPKNQERPKKIFISYAHQDSSELAHRLSEDLKEQGHTVWIYQTEMRAGEVWDGQVEDAILKCEVLVALLSPQAVRRRGICLSEIRMAIDNSIEIVPAMVLYCRPPLGIYRLDWVDFQDWKESKAQYDLSLKRLLQAINNPDAFEGHFARIFGQLKPLDFRAELSRLTTNFTGRKWLENELDDWLKNEKSVDQRQVFFIVGDPGTGKSAFMAHLINENPHVAAYHFCKSDLKDSRDPLLFVRSLACQLATQLEGYHHALENVDFETVKIQDAYQLFRRLIIDPLTSVRLSSHVLIVVDGLDEAHDNNPWNIPKLLSTGLTDLNDSVRFIVTSRKEPAILDRFSRYTIHDIKKQFKDNENDLLNYLNDRFNEEPLKSKFQQQSINPDTVARVVLEKSQGNFLYATQAIAALQSNSIDPAKPEEFPKGLVGFYQANFERMFPAEKAYKQLATILEVVVAALEPLTASQIGAFLNKDKLYVERKMETVASYFPQVDQEKATGRSQSKKGVPKEKVYQAFHKSISEWLSGEVSGRRTYTISVQGGHRTLAKACWKEYLQGIENMSPYALAHLPIHLLASGKFNELVELMKDQQFFVKLWSSNEFDLKTCWVAIEQKSTLRAITVYQPALDAPSNFNPEFLFNLSEFLTDTSYFKESAKLFEYLITHYVKNESYEKLQWALCDLSWAFYLQQNYNDATAALIWAERIGKNWNLKQGLQRCFGYQATIANDLRRFDTALDLYHAQQRICREINDDYWLQISLGNEGTLLQATGDKEKAMELFKEKECISRKIGNLQGLQWALNYQAGIFAEKEDDSKALELYIQQQHIAEEIGYKRGMLDSLKRQQNLFLKEDKPEKASALNKIIQDSTPKSNETNTNREATQINTILNEALAIYKEKEIVSKALGKLSDLQRYIESQAIIFEAQENPNQALKLYKEQEAISKQINDQKSYKNSLRNQFTLYLESNNLSQALEIYRKDEFFLKEELSKHEVIKLLRSLSNLTYQKGDIEGALHFCVELKQICKEIDDKKGLRDAIAKELFLRQKMGAFDTMIGVFTDEKQQLTEIFSESELKKILSDLGSYLYYFGRLDLSLKFYTELEKMEYKNPDKGSGLERCLALEALIYEAQGDFKHALALYQQQEIICLNSANKEDLIWSFNNQGDIQRKVGNLKLALEFYEKQDKHSRDIDVAYWLLSALGNQADIKKDLGELDSALKLFEEQEKICRETADATKLPEALMGQIEIYFKKGNVKKVDDLCRLLEEYVESKGLFYDLQRCLGFQASLFELTGQSEQAFAALKKQSWACSQVAAKEWLQAALGNQDLVHKVRKDLIKYLKLYQTKKRLADVSKEICENLNVTLTKWFNQNSSEVMDELLAQNERIAKICEESNFKMGLQHALFNQGIIQLIKNNAVFALNNFRAQEAICRTIRYKEGIQMSLQQQADILYSNKELEKALSLYNEQEILCLELGNKEDLQACVGRKARIYLDKGHFSKAIALYKQQELICKEIGLIDCLQEAFEGQALVCSCQKEFDKAMLILAEQEQSCRMTENLIALSLPCKKSGYIDNDGKN
jgi:hypothetical protein